MGRTRLHTLIWSEAQGLYELSTRGQLQRRFRPAEDAGWLAWLGEVSTFAFHGQGGSLNVYREQRPRGGAYWYAYQTKEGRTRKRYLGQTERLGLARLEETARALSDAEPPATTTGQGLLLSSRLAPPRLPNALVERERLLRTLDAALSTPLTLLAASAGWGKTTLLAVWAHRQKTPVAWLSLDDLDNSPARFWVGLIAALRRCPDLPATFGENVVAQLQSPQPPPLSSCLAVLLQELERTPAPPAPLVLILDDYQVIEEPSIHQGLAFFLEHLPAHLHLLLSSRVNPNLPLARLRAHGQLTELRMDELRFSFEEARQFLRQMLTAPLSEDEVRQLSRRTEGWIAGLQLAALTLEKRADRAAFLQAFTGGQRYLLDYVREDILARLPTGVRDFLLRVAILSRLDASVCQVVTAEPTRVASQQRLEWLERANLFLVPLDEERRTYRLHDLFREALLTVLHTTQPELVPVLHHRAASYYEAQGQWHEAITHAFAARDYSMAARLMEQTVEQFWVHGEAATVVHWVLTLPEPLAREHARLTLTTALYLLNTVTQTTEVQRARVYQQVRQLMARVETALQREIGETDQEPSATPSAAEVAAAEEALLHRRLGLLRAGMAFYEALATGEQERLSALHQEIQALDQDEEVIWQLLPLFCTFVFHFSIRQEAAVLLPQLLEAKARVSQSGNHFAITRVLQLLATVAVFAGKLRLAYEESQAALSLIEQIAGYTMLKGYFGLALAWVLYQWNRLEEARALLHTTLADAAPWQHLDLLGSCYITLMDVELARGAWSTALEALDDFEQFVQRERYGAYPNYLPWRRARWWLAEGRLGEASDWAAGVVFPEGAWDRSLYFAFPVVIRVYFAQGRFQEALELLERWSGQLDRPTKIASTITYLAQLLVALHQTGKSEPACGIAERLLALTEPEGYVRVYLDEGEPMRQALLAWLTANSRRPQQTSSTTAHVWRLLAAFEHEPQGAGRTLEAVTPRRPRLSPDQQGTAGSSVPDTALTRREQEVLRLLADGASNQEIAQSLVISLETVKKHVSNLLSKLGATSRTQAVAQARARALL